MTRARIAGALLAALASSACSKFEAAGEGLPFLSMGPKWTPQTFGEATLELPGKPVLPPAADGGFAAKVAKVQLRDGEYEFVSVDFRPGVLEGSQNRLVVNQVLDKVMMSDGAMALDSEVELKVEAGVAGITWPARDLSLRTADGRPCQVRELFVRDSLLLLSACRARDDVPFANWHHMRDSLKITADPMPAAASPGRTSEFFTESPDKKSVLRQKSLRADRCSLSCERDGTTKWEAETACIGTALDPHFVADDCERVVMFRGSVLHSDESSDVTPFIFVFAREKPDYQVTGAALRPQGQANKRVSHPVIGLGNNNGERPKYADDGRSVSFQTVDHRVQSVPLFAEPKKKK